MSVLSVGALCFAAQSVPMLYFTAYEKFSPWKQQQTLFLACFMLGEPWEMVWLSASMIGTSRWRIWHRSLWRIAVFFCVQLRNASYRMRGSVKGCDLPSCVPYASCVKLLDSSVAWKPRRMCPNRTSAYASRGLYAARPNATTMALPCLWDEGLPSEPCPMSPWLMGSEPQIDGWTNWMHHVRTYRHTSVNQGKLRYCY